MSEIITSRNINEVIQINNEIKDDIDQKITRYKYNQPIGTTSIPQLGILTLQRYGLIQCPIEDKYWSGAIFLKEGKAIPVINTALPRANQYFTAWHEIYHLFFDNVSFDHMIGIENTLEERKAEYFAARMLLDGVESYYLDLPEMDFMSKVFNCMAMFQAPYKAVLISLYEFAYKCGNYILMDDIISAFDYKFDDLSKRFKELGLDDALVKASYVINASTLNNRINKQIKENPDLNYHSENSKFLNNIFTRLNILIEDSENGDTRII